MQESTVTESAQQDPYSLSIETNFNREAFGNPYDFQVLGGEITRNAILNAMLPKAISASKRNALFLVLQLLQVRLFYGARRKKPSLISKLGSYRYTWDPLPVMADQVHMTPRALQDNVQKLVKLGIIHRATGTNGEPNHYRFTDAAFKMAHALQTPLRVIKFEGECARTAGWRLDGKPWAEGKDWQSLRLIEPDAIRMHVYKFCEILRCEDSICANWHDNLDLNGKLPDPESLDEWTVWVEFVTTYKNMICPFD